MKLQTSDLEQAMADRERQFLDAMTKAGDAGLAKADPDSPEYRLILKKKRAASFIRDALKSQGLGELSKMSRVARVTEES